MKAFVGGFFAVLWLAMVAAMFWPAGIDAAIAGWSADPVLAFRTGCAVFVALWTVIGGFFHVTVPARRRRGRDVGPASDSLAHLTLLQGDDKVTAAFLQCAVSGQSPACDRVQGLHNRYEEKFGALCDALASEERVYAQEDQRQETLQNEASSYN